MRLILSVMMSAVCASAVCAHERINQFAGLDITPSSVEDRVHNGVPNGLPIASAVPATPVLSSAIAAFAGAERGRLNADQPVFSSLH